MIRSLFIHLNIVLSFLVLMIPQLIVCFIDPTGNLSHRVARLWGRWILLCSGVRVRVAGLEHLPRKGPLIFFSNHRSYFDVFSLLAHLPVQYRWLAKEELFRVPLFGQAMRRGGYIPIDRSNTRKAYRSMVEAADRIRRGTSLVIFPEGTRSPDGRLLPFKTGGAVLAIKAQVPAVPVAIRGTERILPKGRFRVGRSDVEIRVGRPISTDGLTLRDKVALTQRLREAVRELLGEEGRVEGEQDPRSPG